MTLLIKVSFVSAIKADKEIPIWLGEVIDTHSFIEHTYMYMYADTACTCNT